MNKLIEANILVTMYMIPRCNPNAGNELLLQCVFFFYIAGKIAVFSTEMAEAPTVTDGRVEWLGYFLNAPKLAHHTLTAVGNRAISIGGYTSVQEERQLNPYSHILVAELNTGNCI